MTDQWEPVDLASLDPARGPDWAARVDATRRAVAAIVARRMVAQGPLDIVGGWARPILAAAAILLVVLGGAEAMLHGLAGPARDRLGEARRLGLLSEAAFAHGRAPTGAELRGILGVPGR